VPPGMGSRVKDVEWLDGTASPIDLAACEVWPASRDNPLCSRLYKTLSQRWVLDPGGFRIEILARQATQLLASWGWFLPGSLILERISRETIQSSPGHALPLPTPLARTKDDLVILFGPHDEPLVRGNPKPALGENAHKIIKTVIEAGESGLSLVALRLKSKQNGARNTLTKIATKDPDWGYVIQFPGKVKSGGYRIGHPGLKHVRSEAS